MKPNIHSTAKPKCHELRGVYSMIIFSYDTRHW